VRPKEVFSTVVIPQPSGAHVRWIALMLIAVIITVGGCGGDSNTIPSLPPDKAVGTAASPASRAPTQSEPEMVVDRYLQAVAGGNESACDELAASFIGRMHPYNGDPRISLIACRGDARDLSKRVSVSATTLSLVRMNATTATVSADVALTKTDAAGSGGSPSEASATSTYALTRQRGKWRINDIVERSYADTLVNELGGPISNDFGGNLVLIRGCSSSARRYC
jgi:hypothetical protein